MYNKIKKYIKIIPILMKSKLFSNDDMFSYFSEKSTIYDSPMRENDLNDSLEIFSNTEDR